MQIIDNINKTVKEDLQESIRRGSKMSVAAACFSMYAYQELKKQLEQVERMEKLENKLLPEDMDYALVPSLRDEAREKLAAIRPRSVGQAGRISGVSPADVSVLLVYLEQQRRMEAEHV